MTDKELEKKVKKLLSRFDDVNTYFIEKVASQIREIGEMSASTIHIVSIMAAMYDNIREINERIAEAAEKTIPELYKIYETALNDVYYENMQRVRDDLKWFIDKFDYRYGRGYHFWKYLCICICAYFLFLRKRRTRMDFFDDIHLVYRRCTVDVHWFNRTIYR